MLRFKMVLRVLFLLVNLAKVESFQALFETFNITDHICVVTESKNATEKALKLKDFCKEKAQTILVKNIKNCRWDDTVVLFQDNVIELDIKPDQFLTSPLIIVTKQPFAWERGLVDKVNVNQLVFVLDETRQDIFEAYTIGGQSVWRKLSKGSPPLEERRLDFMGIHLKVMVSGQHPFNILDPIFRKQAPYFESNSTYEVTDYVTGLFRQVLDTMAARMNFTFTQYQRKDGWWANPVKDDNGQYIQWNYNKNISAFFVWLGTIIKWTGMAGNVLSGQADMIGASLTLTPERATALDYLPALGMEVYQLILADLGTEALSWRTFVAILRPEIWYAVLTMTFSFWIIIVSIQWMTTLKFNSKTEVLLRFASHTEVVLKHNPFLVGNWSFLALFGFKHWLETQGYSWQKQIKVIADHSHTLLVGRSCSYGHL